MPKQGPHEYLSSRPTAVNMGNTRPQVTASSNISGLGQQARLFSEDSALEQRLLTKLMNMKNDKSANPVPAKSNEIILLPLEPIVEPPLYPPMHKYSQPRPVYSKEYFDAMKEEDNKLRELKKKTPVKGPDVPVKTPSSIDKLLGYFKRNANVHTVPPVGPTATPRLTDIIDNANANDNENKNENENDNENEVDIPNEEHKDNGYEIDDEGLQMSPIRPLNLVADERQHERKQKAGKTQWKAQLKTFKQDWAYDNRGSEPGMVDLEVEEIANLTVPKLNAIYDRVMLERDQRS